MNIFNTPKQILEFLLKSINYIRFIILPVIMYIFYVLVLRTLFLVAFIIREAHSCS